MSNCLAPAAASAASMPKSRPGSWRCNRNANEENQCEQGRDDHGAPLPLRLSKRLQVCLDLLAARFQKRRQRELFSQGVQGLIGGEAGSVRGDLEQDAVRLPEIEA